MKRSSGRGYDLDLLRYLEVLVEEQSVSAAARRLGMSEPAMSRYLARLREVFGDPILVMSGRRMVATAFANRVRERVQRLVGEADELLVEGSVVNLKALSPRFVIRTNDMIVGVFALTILKALQKECPGSRVVFSPESEETASDALRQGQIDLYIGATNDLSSEIKRQTLFESGFVALVREGHPIFDGELTPERLVEFDHVSVSRKGRPRGPIDAILEECWGLRRRIAMVLPTYHPLIQVLSGTDLILPVPDVMVAEVPLRELDLRVLEFPFRLPSIHIYQAWHPRVDKDPLHRWLRETVMTSVRERAMRAGEGRKNGRKAGNV